MIRSERLVTTAIGQRVPFSAAPLLVRHLVFSALSTNQQRIAVGDEGANATLAQEQGILFATPPAGTNPQLAIGNADPWDLSQLFLYGINSGDGLTWTGDVVSG